MKYKCVTDGFKTRGIMREILFKAKRIDNGTTFGWYSYVWNENENEYKLITFSLTKLGAKCALKRYKNTRNRVKEYEYEI